MSHITNRPLLSPTSTQILRTGLQINRDFKVVPPLVWRTIQAWYGGDAEIIRRTFKGKEPQPASQSSHPSKSRLGALGTFQVRTDEEQSDELTTLPQAAENHTRSYFSTRYDSTVITAIILTPHPDPFHNSLRSSQNFTVELYPMCLNFTLADPKTGHAKPFKTNTLVSPSQTIADIVREDLLSEPEKSRLWR